MNCFDMALTTSLSLAFCACIVVAFIALFIDRRNR
jgi:hypothetical protein